MSIFGNARKKCFISLSHGPNFSKKWKRSGCRVGRRAKRKRDGSPRRKEFRERFGRLSTSPIGGKPTARPNRPFPPEPRLCWIPLKNYPQRYFSRAET